MEHCFGIDSQSSRSGKVDKMVSLVAFPIGINQVRILCADREDQVEYGEPFLGWSLHSAANESAKLTCEIKPADNWKGGVDSLHVRIEKVVGDLGVRYFVGIDCVVSEYRHVVHMVAGILDRKPCVCFGEGNLGIADWTFRSQRGSRHLGGSFSASQYLADLVVNRHTCSARASAEARRSQRSSP